MRIDILTLFPEMFKGPFDESIVKRAQDKSLVEINIHQLRDWAKGKHKTVDDHPYGGGVGMLLMVEPIYLALEALRRKAKSEKRKVILLDAGGKTYTQAKAQELSELDHLILICGHYEGVDHRVREHLIDEEISIGDYILTGGEIPTMVVVDSIVRLLPGVLEKEQATKMESYTEPGQIETPQYTRPENFKGWSVPEVLLSGDHKKIDAWRKEQSIKRSRGRENAK